MLEPAPLQQVNRTCVRFKGREYFFFGGCDYFRLSSHPRIWQAIRTALRRKGLNVAASRLTTGNHESYQNLERELARFFGAEAALVVGTGYLSSLTAGQALAKEFSHALLDERAHMALKDAAAMLDCPVLTFRHRNTESLRAALNRCGRQARPIVLTDGMFSHDGSVAPLVEYLKLLSRDGWLLVDDAHGAGTLGKTGKGTVELTGITRARVIQCITLSKAFGVYGGAILCSRRLRERMLARSPMFVGSTPLPLPLAEAARTSIKLMRSTPALRRRLESNTCYLKAALRCAGIEIPDHPGPIIALPPMSVDAGGRLRRALLRAAIYPTFIRYPGGPTGGYFRFVISSEHTRGQLDALIKVLTLNRAETRTDLR